MTAKMPTFTPADSVLLLIDHQTGTMQLIKNIPLDVAKRNTVALSHWLTSRSELASSARVIGRSLSNSVAINSSNAFVRRKPASRQRAIVSFTVTTAGEWKWE